MYIKKGRFRKYSFNQNMFSIIDNQDKAYWLGFIFGDGSISKSSLRIEISNKDLNHLHKFKDFMCFNGTIELTRKNCSLLCLNSVSLVKDLLQYNLKRPKILITPNINIQLLSHFYRGFFDADGWITTHKHKKSKNSYEYGFCCSEKNFLIDLQNYLSLHLEQPYGYLTLHKNPLGSVQQLIIGGNKVFPKISQILYNEANYYLDRKYELMKTALFNIENTPDMRGKYIR